MADVYVMCGKVGSGKSTYALDLNEKIKGVILSVDEWMLTAFGQEIPCSEHRNYVERIKNGLFRDGHKILLRGVPIIIDFGFWTKEERDAVRVAFEGYDVEFHWLDVEETILYERVASRNKIGRDLEYHMTRETHEVLNRRFESPEGEEKVLRI